MPQHDAPNTYWNWVQSITLYCCITACIMQVVWHMHLQHMCDEVNTMCAELCRHIFTAWRSIDAGCSGDNSSHNHEHPTVAHYTSHLAHGVAALKSFYRWNKRGTTQGWTFLTLLLCLVVALRHCALDHHWTTSCQLNASSCNTVDLTLRSVKL